MLEMHRRILAEAEAAPDAATALKRLRHLGLDDFGMFLISLPNPEYPNLSRLLPRMASESVQTIWTSTSGITLLRKSVVFVRLFENLVMRHMRSMLFGKRILDFGCGFGRLTRLLYYYSEPDDIVGVDAWKEALDECAGAGMLGRFILCEKEPSELDVEVDVAFSFSVLTHTTKEETAAIFRAMRGVLPKGGLFVVTIRQIEFWKFFDEARKAHVAPEMERAHRESGYAYMTGHRTEAPYGDTSFSLEYLRKISGFNILAAERNISDPYHIVVTLQRP